MSSFRFKSILAFVALLSVVINVLYLTGSLFMMQVYDRVIPSRSVPTLVGLCIFAAGLYMFQAILDLIRSRIMVRLAFAFDEAFNRKIFDAVVTLPLVGVKAGDGLQAVRDLAAIRSFLASGGPLVLFDLPWLPFFLALCFVFHLLIGLTATVGAIVLVAIAAVSEIMTRKPAKQSALLESGRMALAEVGRRNAESLAAMGMTGNLRERWSAANEESVASQAKISDISGGFSSLSKAFRYLLQSAVLAVGAWLVINQQASGGVMIASSILAARALAPADMVVGHWKGFITARQSWTRLKALLTAMPNSAQRLALPPPISTLEVEDLTMRAPGGGPVLLSGVRFKVDAGAAIGVIGPSASGKSCLVRVLAGIWAPTQGAVRLDGAVMQQWNPERLGAHIGYMSQEVELFAGTVAENIARLPATLDSAAVIQAARTAGVHDMILRLPNGYETQIGEHGSLLSRGQRQRIALARALYGEPFLVILDEPNAHLDQEGDTALSEAIAVVRARGGIVVIVAHRPNIVTAVDHILMIRDGRMQAFGPRDEVLARVLNRPPLQGASALKIVGNDEKSG